MVLDELIGLSTSYFKKKHFQSADLQTFFKGAVQYVKWEGFQYELVMMLWFPLHHFWLKFLLQIPWQCSRCWQLRYYMTIKKYECLPRNE